MVGVNVKLYKYQILRRDNIFSVGDSVSVDGEDLKIMSIIKIDTDRMVIYFYGVALEEIDEQF